MHTNSESVKPLGAFEQVVEVFRILKLVDSPFKVASEVFCLLGLDRLHAVLRRPHRESSQKIIGQFAGKYVPMYFKVALRQIFDDDRPVRVRERIQKCPSA